MSLLHPTLTHAEIDELWAARTAAINAARTAPTPFRQLRTTTTWQPLGDGKRRRRNLKGAE